MPIMPVLLSWGPLSVVQVHLFLPQKHIRGVLTQSFNATLTAFLESEGPQKASQLEAIRLPQPELQIGAVTLGPPYCLRWTVFPGLSNVGVDLGGLGVPCMAWAASVCGNAQSGRPPLAFGPASSRIKASFSPGKRSRW